VAVKDMQFLKMIAGSLAVKIISALLFAALAVVGLGPDHLLRIVISWWISDPSYFVLNLARVVSGFIAFVIGAIFAAPWIKSRFWPDPIQHAENIQLAAGMTPQTTTPVLLVADAKTSNDRLRVLVEYSSFHRSLGWAGWLKPRQVLLADLSGTIRGQQIRVPVVHCKPDGSEIWWGGENDFAGNLIQKSTKYRAQIKFIGNNHKEQAYRFCLLRTSMEEAPYVAEVFTEQDLDMKS
jgi:hypothetical protein